MPSGSRWRSAHDLMLFFRRTGSLGTAGHPRGRRRWMNCRALDVPGTRVDRAAPAPTSAAWSSNTCAGNLAEPREGGQARPAFRGCQGPMQQQRRA